MTYKTVGTDTTFYTYDLLGNLTSVLLPDDTFIEYIIDGQNRRVGKKVDNVFQKGWLYQDQLNPVVELDENGDPAIGFVYGTKGHVPDFMVTADEVSYRIVTDHLGSVRLVVNAGTGYVAQQLDYDEFGNVIVDTNPGFQPFGYAGGLYDEQTGLVRFGARDYDAETGRWTAKDPIRFSSGNSNVYNYVNSNPISFIDPSGLDYLRFDGKKITWVFTVWNDLVEIGTQTFEACSGPYGKGRLPEGIYTGTNPRRRSKEKQPGMACPGEETGWSLDIDPIFETDRDLLRIHPDGNYLTYPGTKGCIGIICSESEHFYNLLKEYFQKDNTFIKLEVDYSN